MDSVWEIYSDIEKLWCKVSPSQSEERKTFLTHKINDTSTQNHKMMFLHIVISSCHFSIFKRFEIKNYKADRRRNVYIDTKHMESAL